ncbi:hypothetical protein ARAM_001846 [Aspergillus rambellii]|uniref:Aminoglycoside phosphotransferase domain-containing protein n=1 Tax=Aspergillus rambellii TaxID=308745 RepID=A0A0F8UFN4_9EURO|nr:hypothetical protein ARAM_001846 [Aspergillus rambellii]
MQPRMPFDDVAWEKSEEISDNWVDELFANENTLEVAAIRYLQDHTSIPVPFILHWGPEHAWDFALKDRPRLDPNIDIRRLEMLYGQLADILLQLNQTCLPKIGSLDQVDDDDINYEIKHRPLLAELHMEHLTHQRNDAIDSKKDFQRKYVWHGICFADLPAEHRLTSSKSQHDSAGAGGGGGGGPFKICGIFLRANRGGLLLEQPEYWPEGIEDWTRAYEHRLETFF